MNGSGTSSTGFAIDIGAYELGLAKVVDVIVKGSNWVPGAERSFAELVGLGQQLRPIATQNADTIEIHFDGPVNLTTGSSASAAALKLAKTILNTPTFIIAGDASGITFTYDPATFVASWMFPSTGVNKLESGKYAIFLQSGEVIGVGGEALDGDWDNYFGPDDAANPTADNRFDDPARHFLTGNGTPGAETGSFRLNFALLVGDYVGDGYVEGNDYLLYQQLLGSGWSAADANAVGDDGNPARHQRCVRARAQQCGGDCELPSIVHTENLLRLSRRARAPPCSCQKIREAGGARSIAWNRSGVTTITRPW